MDHISWDEYFMGLALLSAKRSKDPSTKVGSCIVNADNRIVGIGYNGFPSKCSDADLPWGREGNVLDTKYPYVIHAEQNAILNSTKNLKGCKIYITLFPCNECCKLILQSGIIEVIYLEDNTRVNSQDGVIASKRMLDLAKVPYYKYITSNKILTLEV